MVKENVNEAKKRYLSGCATDAGVDLTKLALGGWKNPVSPSLRPIVQSRAMTRVKPLRIFPAAISERKQI